MNVESTREIQNQIQDVVSVLNRELFNDKLQIAKVSVLNNHKKVGSYSEIVDGEYKLTFMVNHMMVSERIFVSRVLHEMVHVHNAMIGLKDTTRDGRYHNAKFQISAIQNGMNVTYDNSVGYGTGFVNDDVFIIVSESLKLKDFSKHVYKGNRTSKSSNSYKHTCPSCGNIARTTRRFPLVCGDCNENMEVE